MDAGSSIIDARSGFVKLHPNNILYPRDKVRIKLFLLVLSCDLFVMALSFGSANLLVVGRLIQNGKPHGLVMFAMIAPVYVLLAINGGALGVRIIQKPRDSLIRAIWALGQAAMLTLLIIYLGKISEQLSRLTFIVGLAGSCVSLAAIRFVIPRIWSGLSILSSDLLVVIVDGVPRPAVAHARMLEALAFGLDPSEHDADMAFRLAAAVGGAERIIVACPADRIDDWSVALQSLEARGEILVPDLARFAPVRLAQHDGYPTLVVAGGPLEFRDRIIKRLFDLVLASSATLMLSPVLLLVAIAIRLDSRGPVLFRQQRLGRDAHPFEIFKFRSMRTDVLDHSADKLTERDDPRITRLGSFLRRSSLDELPQLFNVLRGDMSIVGPRPHAAAAKAADKLYWEVDARYWARHCIKPGMTGLAQVRGHRGATHEHDDLINRLQSDLEYVTNWSIWKDIKIMFATVGVLFHKNAY